MIHRGLGPSLAQVHVELVLSRRGSPIVTVAFDQHELVWIRAQPRRVRGEDLCVARPDRRRTEVEVDIAQLGDRLVVPYSWQAERLLGGSRGTRGCGRER